MKKLKKINSLNKKGFTMVELLTTISILAIIALVGVFAVSGVLDSARKNHYDTLIKNMIVAGRSYYNDTKSFPKVIGKSNSVTVETLVNSKYLDPVKDPNDEKCDYEKSKVTAHKTGKSKYKYTATLVCNNYDNSKASISSALKIDINLVEALSDETDEILISSDSNSEGISSYRYRIYSNDLLLYDSGVVDAKGRDSEHISLAYKNKVDNGSNIRVVASATDVFGNTESSTSKMVVKSTDAPRCGVNIKGASTTWAKGTRTVSIDCRDRGKTKCKESRYSKTFTETTKEGYITIESENGVTSTCMVNVYLDNTAPTAPTSGSIGAVSGSSSSASIKTAAGGSKDNDSGFQEYRYMVTNTSSAPANTNSNFKTSRSYTRSCGTSYYAWAIAVDHAGNLSTVKGLGSTADGANKYSAWKTCSKTCGGGTQTRTNTCQLVTTSLSRKCNTQACAHTHKCKTVKTDRIDSWGVKTTFQCGCRRSSGYRVYCDICGAYCNVHICTTHWNANGFHR